MARIECEVDYTELENDQGRMVDGVVVTCGECGHATESFGTGENSVKRCLALLGEECPESSLGERNFYVTEED